MTIVDIRATFLYSYSFGELFMKAIAAKEAKNNFGEMMDTVQREPITIEKHGRPVAVIMSATEYKELKLERLRTEIKKGTNQIREGKIYKQSLSTTLEKFKTELNDR